MITQTALIALLLASPTAAPPGTGGTIRGRVDVRRELSMAEPRPAPTSLGFPYPHGAPDRRRAVVYLEEAPQSAFPEPAPGRARLDQRDQTFVPYVLAKAAYQYNWRRGGRVRHEGFVIGQLDLWF